MTVESLIEKHFPCVGCDRYVTLRHWSDHFPGCPVKLRTRAAALADDILKTARRRTWKTKRKSG